MIGALRSNRQDDRLRFIDEPVGKAADRDEPSPQTYRRARGRRTVHHVELC